MFRRLCVMLGVMPSLGYAQRWRESAATIAPTARVLFIGTRPENEDNALIAWLSLGKNVETAYLSLTRGESGINRIGAEHGASLAVVRTAELLEERHRDGAHQYFTRAYDFGSPEADSIVERLWPHDSLLRDVVSVVRAFRPQIIISLERAGDRDATRRLTARLAAEAFAVAADSTRMPAAVTSRLPAWTVSRLLMRIDSAESHATSGIVAIDVGRFDRSLGRTYAEVGADIRKLQRSQPALPAPSPGVLFRWLRVDSTRAGSEATLFGAADTTLARFNDLSSEARAQLDTLRTELRVAHDAAAGASGDSVAAELARVAARTSDVRLALPCGDAAGVSVCPRSLGDLAVTLVTIRERADRAMLDAAGLVIDANADRELVAAGDSVHVTVDVYNRGLTSVGVRRLAVTAGNVLSIMVKDTNVTLASDSAHQWSANLRVLAESYHWWQINGMAGGTMLHAITPSRINPLVAQLIAGEDRILTSRVEATVAIGGVEVPVIVQPLVHRDAGAVRGEDRHPLAGVPATSVLLERTAEYERAHVPIDRLFRVYLWSARSTQDTLAVTLRLPPGLTVDSVVRTVVLPPFGARNVFFRLHGTLRPGSDTLFASARSVASSATSGSIVRVGSPAQFTIGFVSHEYPHIPAQQFVRFANDRFEAVDIRLPARLYVAYVKGTDDLATPLGQLQVKFKTLDPALLPVVDLSGFTTVLLGADALAGDAMGAAVPALVEFLRGGGTLVLMPRTDDVSQSGLLPFPLGFDPAAIQITEGESAVKVTDPKAQLLNWPNVITQKDFADWSGGRARGVPTSFDPRYLTVLSMGNAGEPPTAATVLSARVGKGTLVYSSLSIDEGLAASHPGAAHLLINFLSAGLAAPKAP